MRYYKRLKLFLGIIYRTWDTLPGGKKIRVGLKTAWEVSGIVHPKEG